MRVIVIGGVAAGMSAASKLRREDPDAEIDDYPVDENMIETVYGPPEDFEEQVVPAEDGE